MSNLIVEKRDKFEKGIDIKIDTTIISQNNMTFIAGPCSVEDKIIMDEIAHFLKEQSVFFIRGGAYKPRTSPYSFQGYGVKGLEIIREVANKYKLKVVTEANSEKNLEMVKKYSDIIQIGSRNSQNFELLKQVAKTDKPILLKRGFMNNLEEFIYSAEYIAKENNKNIILCERGIRTFENSTRNTLDISSIPLLKQRTILPIISDPSHAAGRRDIIEELTYASIAAGANGIMLEIHPKPEIAISDSNQTIDFRTFERIYKNSQALFKIIQEVNHEK